MPREEPVDPEAVASVRQIAVRVQEVRLGTIIAADDTQLAAVKDSFAPNDTIALVIETSTPDDTEIDGTLDVLWTYAYGDETLTVSHTRQDFVFQGEGSTVFHIGKPDGFPAGRYRVDVALNAVSVARRDFSVLE
jgi:hypothetical protein